MVGEGQSPGAEAAVVSHTEEDTQPQGHRRESLVRARSPEGQGDGKPE